MTGCHCYLHSFLLCQPRLCCPTYFLYALTGWCWHRNCSSLMFYTKSSHFSEVEFLNSSFNNTISDAGDLVRMPPSDSIQSTPHLFWYNYLLSLRFIAVVARGMRWTPVRRYTEIETIAFTKFWVALIVIGIIGDEQKSANESQTTCVRFNAHILYLCPIYLSQNISNNCSSGVEFFKKEVDLTSHIIFDIFSIASPNCCRFDMVCKKAWRSPLLSPLSL